MWTDYWTKLGKDKILLYMDSKCFIFWEQYTLENQFSTIDPEKLWPPFWLRPQGTADWHTPPELQQMHWDPQRVIHTDQITWQHALLEKYGLGITYAFEPGTLLADRTYNLLGLVIWRQHSKLWRELKAETNKCKTSALSAHSPTKSGFLSSFS